jgi:hypothetical protein
MFITICLRRRRSKSLRYFSVQFIVAIFGLTQVAAAGRLPHVEHIVVVIMENHSFSQIRTNPQAPFINSLVNNGALFNNSHGVSHPSQPNYLGLFSGSTQGVGDDDSHSFSAPNLAAALRRKGKAFIGYVDVGSPRKHNPWESFDRTGNFERSFSEFPTTFEKLPDVSFVIPNLTHDMHDGSVKQADDWLDVSLRKYVKYCDRHRSLLILTFDEDDYQSDNRIFTLIYGSMVKPKLYRQNITHYSILRTIEEIEGITPLGESAKVDPIDDIW